MAQSIAVVGDSGTGKSSALAEVAELGIKGLNPAETFIFNVKGKDLPIKGAGKKYIPIPTEGPPVTGNYLASTDPALIRKVMKFIDTSRPDIKNVVLDDAQYIMAEEFMENALKTGFEKFNKLAKNFYDVIQSGIHMRDGITFILLTHSEEEDGVAKLKTLGKMLDQKVNLSGLFTYVLYSTVKMTASGTVYNFATNRVIDDRGIQLPAKSPYGVFEDMWIPNDLGLVLDKIEEYKNS